ncbi:MAG: TIGR00266 family protein [Methylococcaceae bacterium]
MPQFTVMGDVDPFLHVTLEAGEKIYCESNAMVMMEDTLRIKGQMKGGLGQAVLRNLTGGEDLFQQEIEAVHGRGDCLLSPTLPGGIEILTVQAHAPYSLSDGSFVAAEETVQLKSRMNSFGGGLFGGTGGLVIMEASGHGQLAVSGFGSVYILDIRPGRETVIDNNHVVAWTSSLDYEVGLPPRSSGGFFGSLVGAATTGEGLVLKFRGNGQVVVCSRNRELMRSLASVAQTN